MTSSPHEHPLTEFTLEEASSWLNGLSDEARAVIEAAIDADLDKQHQQLADKAELLRRAVTH